MIHLLAQGFRGTQVHHADLCLAKRKVQNFVVAKNWLITSHN
jgi:hypothetical protein